MSRLKLGLFDSGVGGLTVLHQVLKRHPNHSYIYLGDTARVPYGERNPREIRSIAGEAISWLRNQQVDALIMACNTTNALAYDIALKISGVPVYGLIDSAARCIRAKRVGVLSTAATAASRAYTLQIHRYSSQTQVIEQACPAFVPLIEIGNFQDPRLRIAANLYLAPLLAANVEIIMLGCTHYPLLEPLLRQLLPSHIQLLDPARALSKRLDQLLGIPKRTVHNSINSSKDLAVCRFCVTAASETFAKAAINFIDYEPLVEVVSLRSESCSH
uniref:glutamate racemase n=1 Tax=Paulinella chromatophora TaxID=39717 RepID=B1X593_PAUCH|nr:Glutamate racemase [Paulinella chromatophora]ACB43112.1 Glutamate racemase [Paulinella chromatophora]